MRITELDPLADPERTARLWRAVEACCPDASPFVRWPWVGAWLAVYGGRVAPRLIVGWEGDVPAGIALCTRRRVVRHRVFPIRQLHLHTAGEPEGSARLEFNQLLSPWADGFAGALLRHLLVERAWDELVLPGFLQPDLPAALPGLALRILDERPCPAMNLARLREEGRTPEEALSPNTRQQVRRSLRLFGGREQVRLEEAHSGAHAQELLDEMAALHQASWQERGQPGVLGAGPLLSFLRRLVEAGHPHTVQLLRLSDGGGRTLGISLNLLDSTTVYYYQSGLRCLSDPRLKPGLCLHLLAMERHLHAGRLRYDFMATDRRYKRSLANEERTLVWAALGRRRRVRLAAERIAVSLVALVRTLYPRFACRGVPPLQRTEGAA
jgi:CelD/BcsL family acetyltransferase involved in cellulose biosynthesis